MDLTWLKQLQCSPCKVEVKHSGAQLRKAPVEAEGEETQLRGSDKRPIVLETGTVRDELSRKLTQLSLRFQKTSG